MSKLSKRTYHQPIKNIVNVCENENIETIEETMIELDKIINTKKHNKIKNELKKNKKVKQIF
jgi:hypothetical protein